MTEHDDELDRQIRRTVSLAGADAPTPSSGNAPPSMAWGRRLAMAAAGLLVLGTIGVIAARDRDQTASESSSTVATTPETTDASSTSAATTTTPTTEPSPATCDVAIDTYDVTGTMHTIVQSAQPLTVRVEPGSGSWCTGGDGSATVSITNDGAGDERLTPQLILAGGPAKWTLTTLPEVTIAPGETRSIDASFDLPPVTPGRYTIAVYGLNGGAPVDIAGPQFCAPPDLVVDPPTSDGAMGTIHTLIGVTNDGTVECLLPRPTAVFGGTGTDELTLLPTTQGANAIGEPRSTSVLAPGERAVIDLATGNGCLDGSQTPVYWTTLELALTIPETESVTVALEPGSFQTICMLTMSDWMTPPT